MRTILIVDDEPIIRELLGHILEDAGYHVRLAAHGGEALDLLNKERPDLIIADVMMPVLDGVELCRRLKGDAATQEIPIILMSAAARHVVWDAGADAFLDKPFDLETLVALVRQQLERRATG